MLFEKCVWERYRRVGSAYTPLFISLSAAKEPGKGAVEEALAEVGLKSLSDKEDTLRRWLVILDGYDEVQGATNFVIGNKLGRPEVAGRVKVCGGCSPALPCTLFWGRYVTCTWLFA
jgi:hypothetical protein